MDFESVLEKIGGFHRYQKLILAISCILIVVGTMDGYVQVFIAGKSDHWCRAWAGQSCPDLSEVDCAGLKKDLSIPRSSREDGDVVYEQCVKYNTTGISLQDAVELGKGNLSSGEEFIPCDEGWDFDRSAFPSTITIDFELVCEKSYLPNIGQSTYFAGSLVGSFLSGLAADTFGRRLALLAGLVMKLLTTGATVISPNMGFFISVRFFVGFFGNYAGLANFIILMETAAPSKRVFITNVFFIFFAFGYFTLAGMAKLITGLGWRYLQLALALLQIPPLILMYFFVLESPRWLLAKGRVEARCVIKKIASMNNRSFSNDRLGVIHEEQESNKMITNLRVIALSPLLLFIVVNMCFNWFVQSLVYYGLSLSTSSLGIDPYLSFVVSGAIEIPAYLACMFVAEWLGRRGAVFATMLGGGICCSCSTLTPSGIFRVLLATGGKFFITMSYSIVFTWAAELLPTPLRSTGVGLFMMSARVGGIIAPLVLLFEDIWASLPYLVFGSASILAGILSLLIPETRGKPLPTTMEDTKVLYRVVRAEEDI